jgi:hypothetical protein
MLALLIGGDVGRPFLGRAMYLRIPPQAIQVSKDSLRIIDCVAHGKRAGESEARSNRGPPIPAAFSA